MSSPYKVEVVMKYTNWEYYDADGNMVGEQRMYDDWPYEELGRTEISEEELEENRE